MTTTWEQAAAAKAEKRAGATRTCGECGQVIQGMTRELNRHKKEMHPEAAAKIKRAARTRGGAQINRCESCSKFVSIEVGEPEDGGIEVDEEGTISGSVRLVLNCGECGGELGGADAEVGCEVVIEHSEKCNEEERELSISCILELVEEGGGRYRKHLYYAEVSGTVTCDDCEASGEFDTTTEKVAASEFGQ